MAGGETHDRKKEVGVERKKDKDWKCQVPLWHSKEELEEVREILYLLRLSAIGRNRMLGSVFSVSMCIWLAIA